MPHMTASGSINEELHAIDAPKIWLTRLFQPGTAANQSSANQISPSAAIKSKSLADQAFPNHAFLVGTIPHGKSRDSQESLRVLALRHGINPKTVAKWKKRRSVEDRQTGPREPRSTVVTKPSSSHSAGTLCCRWMIACTPCRRRSRI